MFLPMDNILAKLRLRKTKLHLTPFANKPSEAKRLLQDQSKFLTADFGVLSLKKVFFAMKRAAPVESKPWYDMIMKAVENLRPKTES